MKILCEVVSNEFLPIVRALISKNLIEKYGFTQTEVAEILGVSQPLISFYLSGLRAKNVKKFLENKKEVLEEIENLCRKIVYEKIDEKELAQKIIEIAKKCYKEDNVIIPCR
ncbi:MAG: helix-turn-helix domain-containing protein [Nanopusillaceae archaeon]|nr:helix-turn-helix domain-containing protein [Candidatus Aenigmarchaeota archaeon]